jgi:hypothetical protein
MSSDGTTLIELQPWGVSYSGGTFKYTVIGTTGSRSAAQVAQLSQTAHHALQAPYAFLGLGRTNNYIELLFAGSTSRVQEHYTALEGVVPNSRVVALPPHPVPVDEVEGAWHTELFLRPGAWIHWVGAIVVIVLITLSGVVAGLHVAEKVSCWWLNLGSMPNEYRRKLTRRRGEWRVIISTLMPYDGVFSTCIVLLSSCLYISPFDLPGSGRGAWWLCTTRLLPLGPRRFAASCSILCAMQDGRAPRYACCRIKRELY